MTFTQGSILVGVNGRRYQMSHVPAPGMLAVYCVDSFGPYGSIVWIDADSIAAESAQEGGR